MEFPKPVRDLPIADIPLAGLEAYLLQGQKSQVVFMSFSEDVDLPEHSHDAQWGIVLAGSIEMTIDGDCRTYSKGDRYFIPGGVKHSGRIHAGYADITFFETARYGTR